MAVDSSILTMKVILDGKEVSMDLSDDMIINVADINESYLDQPAKYAYWATIATVIRSKANKLKQQIDKENDYIRTTLTGSLDSKIRQQLEMDGEKITESKVMNAIYIDPEYMSHKQKLSSLQDEYLEADEQARLLEVGKETMNQRKEMLISLGAQIRNDFDGTSDFYIKEKDNNEEDMKLSLLKANEIVGKKKSQRSNRKPIKSNDSEE